MLLLPFFCFGQIKSNETPRVTYYLFFTIELEIGTLGAARAALSPERPRRSATRVPRAPPRKIKSNETSLAQMRPKTPFWLFLAPARAKDVGGTPSSSTPSRKYLRIYDSVATPNKFGGTLNTLIFARRR